MAERKTERATVAAPTWRDFLPPHLPPPELITRGELLAWLNEQGIDVTERTLRFWETEGTLPRAVRQSHQGVVQAIYPEWFRLVVAGVAGRRGQGEPLASIAADTPRMIRDVAQLAWGYVNGIMPLNETEVGRDLIPGLEKLAASAAEPGRPIARAVILLFDVTGSVPFKLVWDAPFGPSLSPIVAETPQPDALLSITTVNRSASDSTD